MMGFDAISENQWETKEGHFEPAGNETEVFIYAIFKP